jgi:lipid-binding SYLF domain-containing protein
MRSGLWMTGSGGSGILIARKSDGTWSPPSGIMLHTPTLSFIIGVDIYDCVLIVNSLPALEAITRAHVTLGEDVGLANGVTVPVESNGVDFDSRDLGDTVLAYMKARGQEQSVNLNGCILTERSNENERFYASGVSQMDILSGSVDRYVPETQPLIEVIKMAEGRTDFDPATLSKITMEPAPGDAMIMSPRSSTPASPRPFGMPNLDDPDPFGVLALEMAGLEIREAGSRQRPTSSQFDFNPRPSSSALTKIHRQSGETFLTKSNRESYMSNRTIKSQVTDACTQTDTGNTPQTSPSPGRSEDGQGRTSFEHNAAMKQDGDDEVDYTTVDLTPLNRLSQPQCRDDVTLEPATAEGTNSTMLVPQSTFDDDNDKASKASGTSSVYGDALDNESDSDTNDDVADADDEDDEYDEEPVVFEVAAVQPAKVQAVASRMIQAKGSMVTIPKRIPPPLPIRSPARASRQKSEMGGDVSSLRSPLHQSFGEADLAAEEDAAERSIPSPVSGNEEAANPKMGVMQMEKTRIQLPTIGLSNEKADDATKTSDGEYGPVRIEISRVDTLPRTTEVSDKQEAQTLDSEVKNEEADATQSETSTTKITTAVVENQDQGTSVAATSQDAGYTSDSPKKDIDSVNTATTDYRSSFEASRYDTPNSERASSVHGHSDDETLTKPADRESQRALDAEEKRASISDSKVPLPAAIQA